MARASGGTFALVASFWEGWCLSCIATPGGAKWDVAVLNKMGFRHGNPSRFIFHFGVAPAGVPLL
jgi:hypothetical protein